MAHGPHIRRLVPEDEARFDAFVRRCVEREDLLASAAPHGGIAIGIDRWAALFANQSNIREVMAFPKTQSGGDLMLEAPSAPEPEQLAELGLRFVGVKPAAKPPSEPVA